MKKTGRPPLVVLQAEPNGSDTILGLAYPKQCLGSKNDRFPSFRRRRSTPDDGESSLSRHRSLPSWLTRRATSSSSLRATGASSRDFEFDTRDLVTRSRSSIGISSVTRALRCSNCVRSSQKVCSLCPTDLIVQSLFRDENLEVQEQAVKALVEISAAAVTDHRFKVRNHPAAMGGLARLLDRESRFYSEGCMIQKHAAMALGYLAVVEENVQFFKQFPDTVRGLVKLLKLTPNGNLMTQKEASTALSNLSRWREGADIIMRSASASLSGLVELLQGNRGEEAARTLERLAMVPEYLERKLDSSHAVVSLGDLLNRTDVAMQERALGTLVNLSSSQRNAIKIANSEEFPLLLTLIVRSLLLPAPVTTQHFSSRRFVVEEMFKNTDAAIQERAMRTLANLTSSPESAMKIAGSEEFPLLLTLLVKSLLEPTVSHNTSSRFTVQEMAALTLANLSITEELQLAVADFPNALAGLLLCLRNDNHASLKSDLQEYAAMAVGNLALAQGNRSKILNFLNRSILAGLANLLFDNANPGGQEYAAWAIANLSHGHNLAESRRAAVTIAETPLVLAGLVGLLMTDHHPSCRPKSQEQAVRALANLTFPPENQIRVAEFPGAVKAIAKLLSGDEGLIIQEDATRAIANLTCDKDNRASASEHFSNARIRIIKLLASCEGTPKMMEYGANALGNFAYLRRNHGRLVFSDGGAGVGSLVRMLYDHHNCGGQEQAAFALATIVEFGDDWTKLEVARCPFAVAGLVELSSRPASKLGQDQARRAIAGLANDVLNI